MGKACSSEKAGKNQRKHVESTIGTGLKSEKAQEKAQKIKESTGESTGNQGKHRKSRVHQRKHRESEKAQGIK